MTDLDKLINVFNQIGVPIEINIDANETQIKISENEKTVYYDTVGVNFLFDKDKMLKTIEMVS